MVFQTYQQNQNEGTKPGSSPDKACKGTRLRVASLVCYPQHTEARICVKPLGASCGKHCGGRMKPQVTQLFPSQLATGGSISPYMEGGGVIRGQVYCTQQSRIHKENCLAHQFDQQCQKTGLFKEAQQCEGQIKTTAVMCCSDQLQDKLLSGLVSQLMKASHKLSTCPRH